MMGGLGLMQDRDTPRYQRNIQRPRSTQINVTTYFTSMQLLFFALRRQTAVTAYLKIKQLLFFAVATQHANVKISSCCCLPF